MTVVSWIMRVIDGWKPIPLKTVCAGVNIMSVMLVGMNCRVVPRGGAQVKYAAPRKTYRTVAALGGKRKVVILGD